MPTIGIVTIMRIDKMSKKIDWDVRITFNNLMVAFVSLPLILVFMIFAMSELFCGRFFMRNIVVSTILSAVEGLI